MHVYICMYTFVYVCVCVKIYVHGFCVSMMMEILSSPLSFTSFIPSFTYSRFR